MYTHLITNETENNTADIQYAVQKKIHNLQLKKNIK